jgi:hypothetical protein
MQGVGIKIFPCDKRGNMRIHPKGEMCMGEGDNGVFPRLYTVPPDKLRIGTPIKRRRLGVVLALQKHSFLFHGC